jgi:RHS repeat-associated protein
VLGEIRPGDDTYYLLGLDVIGQQTGSQWSYFGYDGLGSVRQMTDMSGQLQYTASFDPYGNPFEMYAAASTALGFTGEQTDLNGLQYLRARYYNPALGAFLSRDPVQGVMGSALSFNPYLYVQGNPINYVDPTGEIAFLAALAWLATTVAGGTLIGGTTAVAYDVFVNQGVGLGGHNQGNFGAINWERALAVGAFGAQTGFEVSLNAGAGVLTGSHLAGLVRAKAISAGTAWLLGGAADIGFGTAYDIIAHGDNFGESLKTNMLWFGVGEIIGAVGEGVARGARGVAGIAGHALQSVRTFSRNVAETSACLLMCGMPTGGGRLPRQLRLPNFPGPRLFVVNTHSAWLIMRDNNLKTYGNWEGHHGIPQVWMDANYIGYNGGDAPVIAMPNQPNHRATVGITNYWYANIQRRRGWGNNFYWDKISNAEIMDLAERMNAAAEISDELWEEFMKIHSAYSQALTRR